MEPSRQELTDRVEALEAENQHLCAELRHRQPRHESVAAHGGDTRALRDAAEDAARDYLYHQAVMGRLELATRAAGIGVWDWNIADQTAFLDDNMQRILELPVGTDAVVPAATWLNWIHPDDREQLMIRVQDVLTTEPGLDTQIRILAQNSGVHYIRVIATLIRAENLTPLRMIGVCTDVTKEYTAELQRAKAEENLRRSEEQLRLTNAELERAARLKDEFLANMSHELRTPLNAILIIGESLQEEVYGPLTPKQQKALNDVVESGQHLLALINDILDLSKIEAGRIELQLAAVNVAAVCQASLRLVREQAIKKNHRVSLLLPSDSLTIMADERRLKQMLVNLLSNAVKFTPDGGEIGLEVCVRESQAEIYFLVRDTGIGIRPELQSRLFQPFAQLDSALNRQFGGTGLGLALVRRLAELHGGHVHVQSAPNEGSCFTIVVPLQLLDAEAQLGTAYELQEQNPNR